MQGSRRIAVAVRIRPKTDGRSTMHSNERYHPDSIYGVGDNTVRNSDPTSRRETKSTFQFDYVFERDVTQEDIYVDAVEGLVDDALDGSHATVLCYGQTGSGKTYTILGLISRNPMEDPVIPQTGVFLRSMKALIQYAERRKGSVHVVIGLSIMELYLDQVRDLLSDKPQALKVVVDSESVHVRELTLMPIETVFDAVEAYRRATSRRMSRQTDANDVSSRSHAIFSIDIFQIPCTSSATVPTLERIAAAVEAARVPTRGRAPPSPSASAVDVSDVIHSRLTFVDLAGSEKVKTANAFGDSLDELININSSLTALGNVVHALYSDAKHVPYRDSRLTVMLRSCFSTASARLVLIANVGPTTLTFDETQSTLFFADKVKAVKADVAPHEFVRAEVDYLASLKIYEECVAEVRIAHALHDVPYPLLRGTMGAKLFQKTTGLRNKEKLSLGAAQIDAVKAAVEKFQEEEQRKLATLLDVQRAEEVKSQCEAYHRRRTTLATSVEGVERAARARIDALTMALDEITTACEEEDARGSEEVGQLAQRRGVLRVTLDGTQSELDTVTCAVVAERLRQEEEASMTEAQWTDVLAQLERTHVTYTATDPIYELLASSSASMLRIVSLVSGIQRSSMETETTWRDVHTMEMFTEIRGWVMAIVETAIRSTSTPNAFRNVTDWRTLIPARLPPPPSQQSPPGASKAVSPSSRVALSPAVRGVGTPATDTPSVASAASPPVLARRRPRVPEGTHATMYDSPHLIPKILHYVAVGASLLKHCRLGPPHFRFFFLDMEGQRLCWSEDTSRVVEEGREIPFSRIEKIYIGVSADVYRRIPNRATFYHSFSIRYLTRGGARTLDVVAGGTSEMEAWVLGICLALRQSPAFEFPAAYETLEGVDAIDHQVCSEWHIPPARLASVRAKVRNFRRFRAITAGELRIMTQLDVIRASALQTMLVADGLSREVDPRTLYHRVPLGAAQSSSSSSLFGTKPL